MCKGMGEVSMTTATNISMDETVYRLIHHRSYRNFFLRGNYSEMNISKATFMDIKTIDKEQLCASANKVARKILSGSHQGGHGLEAHI